MRSKRERDSYASPESARSYVRSKSDSNTSTFLFVSSKRLSDSSAMNCDSLMAFSNWAMRSMSLTLRASSDLRTLFVVIQSLGLVTIINIRDSPLTVHFRLPLAWPLLAFEWRVWDAPQSCPCSLHALGLSFAIRRRRLRSMFNINIKSIVVFKSNKYDNSRPNSFCWLFPICHCSQSSPLDIYSCRFPAELFSSLARNFLLRPWNFWCMN